jgi:hypothetical protein
MHPSRRRVLGLGAAAAYTATIPEVPTVSASGPDAKLIAQCGETTRLRGMMNAVVDAMMGLSFEKAEEFQPDLDRTTTAYCEAVDLVATLPAASPTGVRAKAACLRESIEEEIGIAGGECMGDRQHVLAWSLLRDRRRYLADG